jgi:hypothetical protein
MTLEKSTREELNLIHVKVIPVILGYEGLKLEYVGWMNQLCVTFALKGRWSMFAKLRIKVAKVGESALFCW